MLVIKRRKLLDFCGELDKRTFQNTMENDSPFNDGEIITPFYNFKFVVEDNGVKRKNGGERIFDNVELSSLHIFTLREIAREGEFLRNTQHPDNYDHESRYFTIRYSLKNGLLAAHLLKIFSRDGKAYYSLSRRAESGLYIAEEHLEVGEQNLFK